MTLHPEAICKQLYKEREYPEFQALNKMYLMQKNLQKFISNKRNLISPPDSEADLTISHIQDYVTKHYTYANLELYNEYFYAIGGNKEELAFEFIDIVHFVFNVLIYSGVQNLKAIEFEEIFESHIPNENMKFDRLARALNISLCDFINALPYKTWKTYSEPPVELIDWAYIDTQKSYIVKNLVKLAIYTGLTKEEFYSYYLSKNEENYERQLDNKKGYN